MLCAMPEGCESKPTNVNNTTVPFFPFDKRISASTPSTPSTDTCISETPENRQFDGEIVTEN